MATECEQFVFAAPPKAGCVQMYGYMEQLGGMKSDENAHAPAGARNKPVVSVFRDPADWLRSWHVNINAPVGIAAVDQLAAFTRTKEATDHTLHVFVQEVLQALPKDGVWKIFESYQPDKWFQTERLHEQMTQWLGRTLKRTRRNESRLTVQLSPEDRSAVYEHEPTLTRIGGYG